MSQTDCAATLSHHRVFSWLAPRIGLGLALAVLADLLFLDGPTPALSLIFFLALLGVAAAVLNPVRATRNQIIAASVIFVAGLLTLFVEASALSYLLAILATTIFVAAINHGGALRLAAWAPRAAALPFLGPFRLLGDLIRASRLTRMKRTAFSFASLVSWILPVAALILFGLLLADGNPLLENWFGFLLALKFVDWAWGRHLLFGLFILCLIWPLIHFRRTAPKRAAKAPATPTLAWNDPLLGAAAMARSLILLNALFALQSATDFAFLWGGMALPERMSYAAYAHRGAYPLVLTALLAALFVLLAMRKGGPAERSNLIRPLVLVWIGQNILLVISSIFRLTLYVAAYSLTELRVAAFIWMILVTTGLTLIVVQILRGRSNAWLLEMNARALAMALFGAALLNIPAIVANYNIAHCHEAGGEGPSLDYTYLWSLGPQTIPALDDIVRVVPTALGPDQSMRAQLARNLPSEDWRSRDYRSWRLRRYLAIHKDDGPVPPSSVN